MWNEDCLCGRVGTNADFIGFLRRAGVTHFKYYCGIYLRKIANHLWDWQGLNWVQTENESHLVFLCWQFNCGKLFQGKLSEAWANVTKGAVAENILNLTKLEDAHRTPSECLHTPTLWLALASLCVLDSEHVERLSSGQWSGTADGQPPPPRVPIYSIVYCHLKNSELINSMEQRLFWEANNSCASPEIPCILWNINIHCCVYMSLMLVCILNMVNLLHTPPSDFFKIHFNIINSYIYIYISRSFKWSIFLRLSPQSPGCIYLHPSICHMLCPSCPF